MPKERIIPPQGKSELVTERAAVLANKGSNRRKIVAPDGTVFWARDAGAFVDNADRGSAALKRTTPTHLSGSISLGVSRRI